jgi:hypothetical protein
MKGLQKAGRKPKGWKPPYSTSLQVKKKEITLTFDDDNIKGDLKDLMMKVKDSQEDQE